MDRASFLSYEMCTRDRSADRNGKNKTKRRGGTHIWICVMMEHCQLLLGYLAGFLLKVKNTVECLSLIHISAGKERAVLQTMGNAAGKFCYQAGRKRG